MIKIKGIVKIPKNLKNIIESINEAKKINDKNNLLSGFTNLIDPLLLSIYFGLFVSKELPPLDKEEIILEEQHDFNVNIDTEVELLNHLLFCLWVKKNGFPQEANDINQYRRSLYNFIEKILDSEYYRLVIIPFYLQKADEAFENGPSFLYRLSLSSDIGIKLDQNSPEHLSMIFKTYQKEFVEEIMTLPLK
jgi:hypothetical protein